MGDLFAVMEVGFVQNPCTLERGKTVFGCQNFISFYLFAEMVFELDCFNWFEVKNKG